MFFGIRQAVQEAKKEMRDASYRMVILIGDKGNHPEDAQGLTAAQVASLLKEEHCDFYALHVVSPQLVDVDSDVQLFKDQTAEIIRGLDEGSGQYVVDAEPQRVAQRIVTGGTRAVAAADTLGDLVTDTATSGTSVEDLKSKYGTRFTRRMLQLMKEKSVSPEIFSKASVQLFERGWVAENDCHSGHQQVAEVILTDRSDLETLVALLGGFLKTAPTKQEIIRTWTSVLQIQLGEDVDLGKPVAVLIRNHLGLPIRNKMLAKSVLEIANLSPVEFQKLRRQLRVDLVNMRAVLSEEEISIAETDSSAAGAGTEIAVKLIKPHRYWFPTKGGDMAWIPYEKMP